MVEHAVYEELDPEIKKYVDVLVDHAHAALWPERKAALLSFRRGIHQADPEDLASTLKAVGLAEVRPDRRAETLFRVVLTAYLERLDEPNITNPDQALLFGLSLDEGHAAAGERWFIEHPEYLAC